MSRNYSPKTFLRQTPNHILKDYFDREKPQYDRKLSEFAIYPQLSQYQKRWLPLSIANSGAMAMGKGG
jgi:hypothetical protein